MRDSLQVGLENEKRFVVGAEHDAGSVAATVLATPVMIGWIEHACYEATAGHLDEGESTVGTHVCVSHEGPAGEGDEVVVRCRLVEMERKRLVFDVTVETAARTISRGTHQRHVVSYAGFQT